MDITYVLLNTFVYGSMALVISAYFAYGKFLNFAIGAFMTMLGYIIYNTVQYGMTRQTVGMIVLLLVTYLGTNRALLKYFPNTKQRDYIGLVITIGLNICLQNICNYVYGPNGISVSLFTLSIPLLIGLLAIVIALTWYVLKASLLGKLYIACEEQTKILGSLGVKTGKLIQGLFASLLGMLFMVALLVINQSSIKASDGIFYLIKGIGIMLLVGIAKKEWMYIGALLYVVVEYLLFIQRGFPMEYKETLILLVILLVLIFKPEGLFMIRKRKI